jgi:NTE family protein
MNARIDRVDAKQGYRFANNLVRPNNDPQTLFLLAFSGGGTRASALSFGVLEALQQTQLDGPRGRRTMLDEVDAISSVSGGSFTSLAYALYGERVFEEYPKRFLYRNVDKALFMRVLLNPVNWIRLWAPYYGRSDLAAAYYDEILFEGATFGDLIEKPTPTVIAEATDISTGARVSFLQNAFDVICSDLARVKLSHAVTASSAVPLLFSPVTLYNFGGTCGYQLPPGLASAGKPTARAWPGTKLQQHVKDIERFAKGKDHPYIHLVDGGLAGNLGIDVIISMLVEIEANQQFREAGGLNKLRRVIVIVVDAHTAYDMGWDKHRRVPGEAAQLMQSISVPMARYSYASLNDLQDLLKNWSLQLKLQKDTRQLHGSTPGTSDIVPEIEFNVVYVSFDALSDPVERSYFLNLPTSLALPSEAVDRLRAVGGRLMRESDQFQKLIHELDQTR